MHTIRARNVCEALPLGVAYLLESGIREDSRAGPVLVAPGPVATVYERPAERVLTSPVRDANPFFHLMESMWMLAGRRDAAFLNNFVRDFGERFAEPDGTVHGAYGHRWRSALGYDQLDHVVDMLRKNPTSRQCVVQMWDTWSSRCPAGECDAQGLDDLRGLWRDRPCNTHAYLRVRGDRGMRNLGYGNVEDYDERVLDLTVLCRSNDIIWGAYGANAVHMSVLQEYLAARIGVGVGRYYQVSNNYHMYVSEWDRLRRWASADVRNLGWSLTNSLTRQTYGPDVVPQPLVDLPECFDTEVRYILNLYESLGEGPPDSSGHESAGNLLNRFLGLTVWPVLMAHRNYKMRNHAEALRWAGMIFAPDWQVAVVEWLGRRTM